MSATGGVNRNPFLTGRLADFSLTGASTRAESSEYSHEVRKIEW